VTARAACARARRRVAERRGRRDEGREHVRRSDDAHVREGVDHRGVSYRIKNLGALGAILILALSAASASAAGMSTREFTVDVTGIHQVEWSWRAGDYGKDCSDWTAGAGAQTIGFSQARPARYRLLTFSGKLPQGLPRVSWVAASLGKAKIAARRTLKSWNDHLAPARCSPCDQEGGGCEPVPDRPQPAAPVACPKPRIDGEVAVGYFPDGKLPGDDDDLVAPVHPDGPALQVQALVRTAGVFSTCLPDLHQPLRLQTPDPGTVSFFKLSRLARLAVGRSMRLKGSIDVGAVASPDEMPTAKRSLGCDKKLVGPGYTECAVTDVTVEIRRRK
jgi:hypothetical protein